MNFNRIKTTLAAAFVAVAALSTGPARAATMLGDVVTVDYIYPTITQVYTGFNGLPATFTVVDGTSDAITARFLGQNIFRLNIDSSSISLTFLSSVHFTNSSFNGIRISGVTQGLNGISYAGPGSFSFANNAIYINLANQTVARNTTYTATPDFSADIAAVVLPGTLPLAAGGFGLLVFLRRRKLRTALKA